MKTLKNSMAIVILLIATTMMSQKQYQIRAVKNGVELDRIVFKAYILLANEVSIDKAKQETVSQDIIRITPNASKDIIIVWEHGYFKQLNAGNVFVSD